MSASLIKFTYNTTPTFQEWVGLLNPAYFVDGIRTFHGIALTITKLIDFYSQCVLFFCLSLFSIETNYTQRQ